MNGFSKGILKLVVVCAVCSFVYAITTMTLERVAWTYADHVSNGVLRAQDWMIRHRMKNFGHYIYHLEIMLGKNGLPITEMTWEEFRIEQGRKLALELKIARCINGIVGSYLGAELEEGDTSAGDR